MKSYKNAIDDLMNDRTPGKCMQQCELAKIVWRLTNQNDVFDSDLFSSLMYLFHSDNEENWYHGVTTL